MAVRSLLSNGVISKNLHETVRHSREWALAILEPLQYTRETTRTQIAYERALEIAGI